MFRQIFAALILILVFNTIVVNAQFPESVEVTNENATVTLRNFRWMTAQKTKPRIGSSFYEPVDTVPLDSSKLYPPGTTVYLFFDYKSIVMPSEKPESVSEIFLTLKSKEPGMGNLPTTIKESEGTEFIGLVFGGFGGPTPKIEADLALNISIYGKRKNGQVLPTRHSDESVKLKVMIDGVAVISESQFEALKSMYRRLDLLEKRIKELESRK